MLFLPSRHFIFFFLFIFFLVYYASLKGLGIKVDQPSFAVSWLDDKNIYQAGEIASIRIRLLDNSPNSSTHRMYFSLSVGGKKGNSSYISGVSPYTDGDPSFWNISFIPIQVGDFSIVVVEDYSGVTDSSLHFSVIPGHLYPSASLATSMNVADEFVAGVKAYLMVFPKDAFGNNISLVDARIKDYFMLSASYQNGSSAEVLNILSSSWNELGYIGIEFIPTAAGSLLLHVYGDNQTLNGSPLPFAVMPGLLNISNTMARWKYEINSLQIFSKLEIFIHQRDEFGNLVPGFYSFDAKVVQKSTGLSVPVADLLFEEVSYGIQLLSFIVSEPGDFVLTIFKLNESISNMPYHFTVFIGYCHGLYSVANGSGIVSSISGIMSHFTVFLEDLYQNPSPIEAERLYVQIWNRNGSFMVKPVIFPLRSFNGTLHGPVAGLGDVFVGPIGIVPASTSNDNRSFIGKPTIQASDFRVTYIPEKSGEYDIWIFCGNIMLNNGSSYFMKVLPGIVDITKSSIVSFAEKVKRFKKNEISVQLVDSYGNPVPSHESDLSLQIQAINNSRYLKTDPTAYEDGLYTVYYILHDLGKYNLCISFSGKILPPCPIEIHVHEGNYFPEANSDIISVWEDESVAFDVLLNDYALDGQVHIVDWSKPLHGSLLQYGKVFRYTPYKGYFGDEFFLYNISDSNNNVASGRALISVLCKPPQFVSLPLRLNVTEDAMSIQFGGFPGFKIMYSDTKENISLSISANSGSIYLAPTRIDISEPVGGTLSIKRGGREGKGMILAGQVEIINSALQSIQYQSNKNFYGDDIISFYATNKNGMQDAHVPVFVEPINNSPTIHAPKLIILAGNEVTDGFQIFDKQRDVFEFSVTDTDIFHYQGNKSHLMIMLSMEVNDGLLSTTLPGHLIKAAEVKMASNSQWEPLQTYVTIENQFILKGKGLRFRGSIEDCNIAMQRLFYQGINNDAMLVIRVNDLGNFGCHLDCTNRMSLPLSAEATVNIIKRRPLNSPFAFLLGSAIFFEIAMLFLFGGLLLFFLCKCMKALRTEGGSIDDRKKDIREVGAVSFQNSTSSDRMSTHVALPKKHSNLRQRSCRSIKSEESRVFELPLSYHCTGDDLPLTPSIEMQKQWQSE